MTTTIHRRRLLECLAAGACLPLAAQQPYERHGTVRKGNIQPWFHTAALGLFIHWGPCSVGEVEIGWGMFKNVNPPNIYWPPEKYNALADRFNPQNYDPDKWMAAAARAGFRYAVLTVKHCDGYTLWPSNYGDFGTKQKMQGRDLVRPYVEACRKHGLKVGFYYCPADWNYRPKGWPHRSFPRRDPSFLYTDPMKRGIPKFVRNAVSGEMFLLHFAWSGRYPFEFFNDHTPERDQAWLHFRAGLAGPGPFRVLQPGETATTPAVYLGHTLDDLDGSVQALHRYLREAVLPPLPPGRVRPVEINSWGYAEDQISDGSSPRHRAPKLI
jgi:hypothetical protein